MPRPSGIQNNIQICCRCTGSYRKQFLKIFWRSNKFCYCFVLRFRLLLHLFFRIIPLSAVRAKLANQSLETLPPDVKASQQISGNPGATSCACERSFYKSANQVISKKNIFGSWECRNDVWFCHMASDSLPELNYKY